MRNIDHLRKVFTMGSSTTTPKEPDTYTEFSSYLVTSEANKCATGSVANYYKHNGANMVPDIGDSVKRISNGTYVQGYIQFDNSVITSSGYDGVQTDISGTVIATYSCQSVVT